MPAGLQEPSVTGTKPPATPDFLKGVKDFVQTGLLGGGTFGVVVRALDMRQKPPREVAVKLLERGKFMKEHRQQVKREIDNQRSLRHPLVIAIYEVFLTRTHLALVMEYARGGDLYNWTQRHGLFDGKRRRLLEQQAQWIFQQLILGLDYCHRRGVASRDLKLENLLLDHGDRDGIRPLLKICDFGYSKHELSSPATSGAGTPVYMAPEVILGGNDYIAKSADVWSCGVILYALLFGRYPFSAREPHLLPRAIVAGRYTIPKDVEVSVGCLDMLAKLLVASPEHRISMQGIKTHRWFLAGLPPGALAMNDFLLQGMHSEPQSIGNKEVGTLIERAHRTGIPGEPIWAFKFNEKSPTIRELTPDVNTPKPPQLGHARVRTAPPTTSNPLAAYKAL